MSQHCHASSYRSADVLTAFSSASAEADEWTRAALRGRCAVPQPQPSFPVLVRAWLQLVRGKARLGGHSQKPSRAKALANAGFDAAAQRGNRAGGSDFQSARSVAPEHRHNGSAAKLISHFAIPDNEDSGATA